MAVINLTLSTSTPLKVKANRGDALLIDGHDINVRYNGFLVSTIYSDTKTCVIINSGAGLYTTELGNFQVEITGQTAPAEDAHKALDISHRGEIEYVELREGLKAGGNPEQIKKLSEKVSAWATPEEFNAKGDGIADDTYALISATSSGINKIKLGYGKTYKVTKQIQLKSSFMELDMNGATILFDSSQISTINNKLFYINNDKTNVNDKRTNVTGVGVSYKIGNTPEKIMGKFTVEDVSKLKVGDTVAIEYQTALVNTHTLNDLKPSVGTHAKILEIDVPNKIVYTDYYTELDFKGLPPVSGSGFMYVTDPIKNITIKNGELKSITKNSADKFDCAIRAEYVDGITLKDITVTDFNHMAVQQRWARNSEARNIHSKEQQGDKSLSYVMQSLNIYKGTFENISGTSNDAILDFSYGCSYIYVRNVHSSNPLGAWGAIQLHGECEHDILFENCSGYFSFANNVGEFPGMSYNITLDNCKGATYLNGCDNLRITDSNLIVRSTDFSNLRVYGVNINDSKIKLVRSVLYKGSTRGGNISPYVRFSNCEVSPYLEATTGLYKFPFIQLNEVSFTNNCKVFNTYNGIGAYFMFDSIKTINISNSELSGFVFSVRTNDGGTSAPFTFDRVSLQGNSVTVDDINCATKTFTTSLDAFLGFSNVSDLTGKINIKDNSLYFKKTHERAWKLLDIENISATSKVRMSVDGNDIYSDTAGEVGVYLPNLTGVTMSYDGNKINPDIVSENGVYRLSNYYTSAPTSGTWDIRKVIYNKTPTVSGKLGWVCISGGSPGTWKTYGNIDA